MTASLTDLSAAHGQGRAVVVDHQAAQLVARALLADVVAAQLAELLQLLVRQLDAVLEHDPDDRLQEWWRGQTAQVRPVGLGLGQEAARIEATGNRDAVVLVGHELQEFDDLVEAIVVVADLEQ